MKFLPILSSLVGIGLWWRFVKPWQDREADRRRRSMREHPAGKGRS